jgi:predicted nucleic acid-binding protein
MHLLDINVWLALAFKRHMHHAPGAAWFRAATARSLFCRFTQAGFLRLASNPAAMGPAAVTMAEAWRAYDALRADPNVAFADEPEGIEPRLAVEHRRTYLLAKGLERRLSGRLCSNRRF